MSEMTPHLDEEVARTLDAEVHLLPVLAELLADLQELGTPTEHILSALGSAGVQPGAAVVDLGYGKGAVAVALAERLGLRVEGIDGFPPFVEAARVLAAERGVSSRCFFRQGDIRSVLGSKGRYDVVLLLSVGPVSGDHQKTVADLRRLVRPGGWMVIEDGFLADGVAQSPGWEAYADNSETLRRLTAFGDELIQEIVSSAEETRSVNERNTALIRRRAHRLKAAHPDLAGAIEEYLATQERETEILGTQVTCAVWVLRRLSDRPTAMEQPAG